MQPYITSVRVIHSESTSQDRYARQEMRCHACTKLVIDHHIDKHHSTSFITSQARYKNSHVFILHKQSSHSSSHAVAAIVGISHLPQEPQALKMADHRRLPRSVYGPTPPVESTLIVSVLLVTVGSQLKVLHHHVGSRTCRSSGWIIIICSARHGGHQQNPLSIRCSARAKRIHGVAHQNGEQTAKCRAP